MVARVLCILALAAALCCAQTQNTQDCKYGKYDFTPLQNLSNPSYILGADPLNGKPWYINVCADAMGAPCKTQSPSCQYGSFATGSLPGNFTDLDSTLFPDGGANLTYYHGQPCQMRPRQTSIYLICNSSIDVEPGIIVKIEEYSSGPMQCMYHVYLQSKYACRKGGIDVGWILIIIVIVCVILYLGVGVVYKWRRHDAKGLDLIPNIEIWREIPGLIKDGFMFTYHKITCRGDQYQAI